MACKKVLPSDKFKNIKLLFPNWNETLEREERKQEDKDLAEFAAVKELEKHVCFDYPAENSENEKIYEQNEIKCYLSKRREHFSKNL